MSTHMKKLGWSSGETNISVSVLSQCVEKKPSNCLKKNCDIPIFTIPVFIIDTNSKHHGW